MSTKQIVAPPVPKFNESTSHNENKSVQENFNSATAQPALSQQATPSPSILNNYLPPPWAGTTTPIPYTFEIVKNGSLIDTINLQSICNTKTNGYITLGRAPTNDILLDHPSSSRVHAILQFRKDDGLIFLFDPGATHGNFLNKRKVPPKQYIPMSVGDQLRCGESSRVYCLCGPTKLMADEGPSREQRRHLAAVRAMQSRKSREAEIAKAQMTHALHGHKNLHTNAHDDYDDGMDNYAGDEVNDWRVYASTHELTEKQQKFVDKIRKKERRIAFLQQESEKIANKQRAMEETTVGQATTLARNEHEIDRAMVEMEEIEDLLLESIRDALSGKKKEIAGRLAKKRKNRGSDDEEAKESEDDDDDFYDRTAVLHKGGPGAGGNRRHKGSKRKDEQVEDAASLYGKLQLLREERAAVEGKILLEQGIKSSSPSLAPPSRSSLVGTLDAAPDDELDAFMSSVTVSLQSQRCTDIAKRLQELQREIEAKERLLRIADPDGYYVPGSHVAQSAVDRAKQTQCSAVVPVNEREKNAALSMENKQPKNGDDKDGDKDVIGDASMVLLQQEYGVGKEEKKEDHEHHRNSCLNQDAVVSNNNKKDSGGKTIDWDQVTHSQQCHREIEAALAATQSNPQRAQGARGGADGKCSGADNGDEHHQDDQYDEAAVAWQPPQGQSGDGRTSLNDALGY